MLGQSLFIVYDGPSFATDADSQTEIGFCGLLYKQKVIRLITDSYENYLLPLCENILNLCEQVVIPMGNNSSISKEC